TVVDGNPVTVNLRHAVRAARVEGRRLALGDLSHLAEHLTARRLVEADRRIDVADRVQQARHAERGDVAREHWLRPRGLHEALRGEVVDLVRLALGQRELQRRLIEHVAWDQMQAVLNVLDPAEVDRAGAADQPIYLVAFFKQELGQIRTVLPGDPGDQRAFSHV